MHALAQRQAAMNIAGNTIYYRSIGPKLQRG